MAGTSLRWASLLPCCVLLSALTGPSVLASESLDARELSLGFAAKVLCSSVFVSDLPLNDALEWTVNPVLFPTLGLSLSELTVVDIDRKGHRVTVGTSDESTRTAAFYGSQGCVLHPLEKDGVYFTPIEVTGQRSYADEAPGRLDPTYDWDNNDVRIDRQALEAATNAAFQPGAHTAAFVVVHKGEVIAERYGAGADRNTALVGWSMGKSITTTLLGVLMEQGEELALNSPAPVPKWQAEADPRKDIRLVDLLHMSSGLRFSTLTDPESTWHRAHPDHMLVYSGAMNVFDFSEAAPPEFPPNSVGRYRNCDPLIVGSIIRRTVEARGQNYLLFPYTDLFQPVGIRGLLLEPDLYGNFVMTGFDYGRGRDWARLGQLYLQDGVWNKTRILPKGWAALVATPAPAWDEPEYGAFFWLNDAADWALPKDSFYMAGGGGQYTIIVPSLDLVVVRMGHYKGGVTLEAGSPSPANKALNEALALIVMAVANDRSDNKEDRT